MASNDETVDESKENNHKELDNMYSELEVILKARNKNICRKDISLPFAITEDIDLSDSLDDENIPQVKPHKHIKDNEQKAGLLIEQIRQLKRTSELEMDFVIDEETNQEDEASLAISRLRQQSEKLFKKIINSQVGFNECLSNSLIMNNSEKTDLLKKHTKLIEQTCKFDRGIESVIRCDKDILKEHVENDLKIESVNQFNNIYNDLAQGILSTVYEASVKKSKNHEHLLAIKEYNKPSGELCIEMVSTGKLDPFTRQPITKPVRNKVCKHIYDQDSVDQMFHGKKFVPCPYIGCTNKHFTKADILYEPNISNEVSNNDEL